MNLYKRPYVAAVIFSSLLAFVPATHGESLSIETPSLTNISIIAEDVAVSTIIRELAVKIGFKLVDRSHGNCGKFSGSLRSTLDQALTRVTRNCSFLIKTFESDTDSPEIGTVFLFRDFSGGQTTVNYEQQPSLIVGSSKTNHDFNTRKDPRRTNSIQNK